MKKTQASVTKRGGRYSPKTDVANMPFKKEPKAIKVDAKKVGQFLKSLAEVDFIYLQHTVNFCAGLKRMIDRYGLTKKQVCERFEISPKKYNNFVSGNFNYSTREFAVYNCIVSEYEKKKIDTGIFDTPITSVGHQLKAKRAK